MPPVTPSGASAQATSNARRTTFSSTLHFAFALGLSGVAPAEAYAHIDVAVRATARSQATAFRLREAATDAFYDGEEAAEKCELRAYRTAAKVFSTLPGSARLADFAAALRKIEPQLSQSAAGRIARDTAERFAHPPIVQRGSAPGPDPFAERRIEPSQAEIARHRRALAMLSGAQPLEARP